MDTSFQGSLHCYRGNCRECRAVTLQTKAPSSSRPGPCQSCPGALQGRPHLLLVLTPLDSAAGIANPVLLPPGCSWGWGPPHCRSPVSTSPHLDHGRVMLSVSGWSPELERGWSGREARGAGGTWCWGQSCGGGGSSLGPPPLSFLARVSVQLTVTEEHRVRLGCLSSTWDVLRGSNMLCAFGRIHANQPLLACGSGPICSDKALQTGGF